MIETNKDVNMEEFLQILASLFNCASDRIREAGEKVVEDCKENGIPEETAVEAFGASCFVKACAIYACAHGCEESLGEVVGEAHRALSGAIKRFRVSKN